MSEEKKGVLKSLFGKKKKDCCNVSIEEVKETPAEGVGCASSEKGKITEAPCCCGSSGTKDEGCCGRD